jgi:hypothetical protein
LLSILSEKLNKVFIQGGRKSHLTLLFKEEHWL